MLSLTSPQSTLRGRGSNPVVRPAAIVDRMHTKYKISRDKHE